MVGDFLNEFPARLGELRRLESVGQWTELERAAHSLKGLAALFGFPKLSEKFLTIEDAAEAGAAGRVKNSLADLDEPAGSAAQQLRGWLDANRSQPTSESA
jgi:HPt (histidine-containing phosphotransfer) domain-containing protein